MIEKQKKKRKPLTTEQRSIKHHRQRMKYRAAILSICLLGEQPPGVKLYQVWGGKQTHIVRVVDDKIYCDCLGWPKARDHECSHVMKYKLVYEVKK